MGNPGSAVQLGTGVQGDPGSLRVTQWWKEMPVHEVSLPPGVRGSTVRVEEVREPGRTQALVLDLGIRARSPSMWHCGLVVQVWGQGPLWLWFSPGGF